MILADYVIKYLSEKGIKNIFTVSGGGSIFLCDALYKNKKINYVSCHHEQAVAFATESYARYSNSLGAAIVTTGPGGTNAITGVGHQPDKVWIKQRNAAINHYAFDAVRGATNQAISDQVGELMLTIATDDNLAELVTRLYDGETQDQFDPVDDMRLYMTIMTGLRRVENIFLQIEDCMHRLWNMDSKLLFFH